MSKARGWPRGWQMPDPRAAQNLLLSHPGTNKAGKCPTIARRRGGGVLVQLELTGNEVKDVSFACNLFLIN